MGRRTRPRVLALAVAAAILAGACVSGEAAGSKSGGSGQPVTLRMASTNAELIDVPAVNYFVERVEELSGGEIRIEVLPQWGDFATDVEQEVVKAVASGEVDLGWVGTRVFDTMGVPSFQALTAPMLVDSYPLEDAVIESGITEQMMEGLSDIRVAGIGVFADGLRRPFGVTEPIHRRADWRGIGFGTWMSEGQELAISALGASPVIDRDREGLIDRGAMQGFEMSLWTGRGFVSFAPYVTANVILWPQMDVVLADPDRLAALTAHQRTWLRQAADDAADRSADLLASHEGARTMDGICQVGGRFSDVAEEDLIDLRYAFEPVYTSLEQDPQTKVFIERIEALKRSIPEAASLVIPAGCTGESPEQPTPALGEAPAYLNGTYRWVITEQEALEAGDEDPEAVYPAVDTITLRDGRLEGGCFGSLGGSYGVEGTRITFHSDEFDYETTVTFERDDHGNLHLTPVPPIDPGDAFTCYSQVWKKIA